MIPSFPSSFLLLLFWGLSLKEIISGRKIRSKLQGSLTAMRKGNWVHTVCSKKRNGEQILVLPFKITLLSTYHELSFDSAYVADLERVDWPSKRWEERRTANSDCMRWRVSTTEGDNRCSVGPDKPAVKAQNSVQETGTWQLLAELEGGGS